jgi:hypothetical protein
VRTARTDLAYHWLNGNDAHFPSSFYRSSKKFVLFPPWEWENLYLYPRIHPSWHKSQLSFDAVPLDTYPNARHARAYEVPCGLSAFMASFGSEENA